MGNDDILRKEHANTFLAIVTTVSDLALLYILWKAGVWVLVWATIIHLAFLGLFTAWRTWYLAKQASFWRTEAYREARLLVSMAELASKMTDKTKKEINTYERQEAEPRGE